jgi:hypothetical protein
MMPDELASVLPQSSRLRAHTLHRQWCWAEGWDMEEQEAILHFSHCSHGTPLGGQGAGQPICIDVPAGVHQPISQSASLSCHQALNGWSASQLASLQQCYVSFPACYIW